MAEKPKGPAPSLQDRSISFGGESLTLRFSLRAWETLVDQWGLKSVQQAQQKLADLGETMNASDLVDVFWASLRTHHPEISREEAYDMADRAGVAELSEILNKLIIGSAPAASGKKENPQTARRRSR